MSYLFAGRENFDEDISRWDVSNVTDMSHMFDGATIFNQNIGSWNVSNVTDMSSMFRNAKSFDGDISTWNTANVRLMDMMFEGAESFNQNINTKPIENSNGQILYTAWDVSNVVYLFNMFLGATSFNGIVSDWTLDPSKFLEGTSGSLGSGLNITLYLKNLAGNREKIIINPFYTVAHLKQKLYDLLINKYGDLGNNRFLNILIDIPSEERRNLSNEEFLQRARLQDQRELRSYGIKNNDILTYIKTREEN
jgi:surface protein